MDLTPEERARWQTHKKRYCQESVTQERKDKIIELCRNGASWKRLKEEVGGGFEVIVETRSRGRRKGAY